jgi:hypothetical protein
MAGRVDYFQAVSASQVEDIPILDHPIHLRAVLNIGAKGRCGPLAVLFVDILNPVYLGSMGDQLTARNFLDFGAETDMVAMGMGLKEPPDLLGVMPGLSQVVKDHFFGRGNSAVNHAQLLSIDQVSINESSGGWKGNLDCMDVFRNLHFSTPEKSRFLSGSYNIPDSRTTGPFPSAG